MEKIKKFARKVKDRNEMKIVVNLIDTIEQQTGPVDLEKTLCQFIDDLMQKTDIESEDSGRLARIKSKIMIEFKS